VARRAAAHRQLRWATAPVSFEPGDIHAQSSTFKRVGDGWVAWDAYKDDGPYQIGWSYGDASGRHTCCAPMMARPSSAAISHVIREARWCSSTAAFLVILILKGHTS
jgi:hypothetical protein